jgi:RNA polymerase sigma-70 factor (ECF subfamily)
MDKDEEKALIKRCRKGCKESLAKLYSEYKDKAYHLALRILRNREDAQDITQEAFMKVSDSISSYDLDRSFLCWLYGIVAHVARKHLKEKRKIKEVSLEMLWESRKDIEGELADKDPGPYELLAKNELETKVWEAISTLPFKYQIVVILRQMEGLSTKETTQALKISQGAVKMRLQRGRELFEEEIKPYFEGKEE